jgi:hypothetical protein
LLQAANAAPSGELDTIWSKPQRADGACADRTETVAGRVLDGYIPLIVAGE